MKKVPVYVTISNFNRNGRAKNIDISIESIKPEKTGVTKQVHFIYPEA
jgi:hypothetical protein